jgi:hypothetical protein
MNQALSHMTFWILQHIQQVHLNATAIEKNETLSPEDKQLQKDSMYRTMLSLLIILKPALEFAKIEYPAYMPLLDWADAMLKEAFAKEQITGTCSCNSCTPVVPVTTEVIAAPAVP